MTKIYKPYIDSLRAVAVILVLVFHAFPSVITGGFVGVDIFFVISGYLITSIIQGELDSGGFKFSAFFGRRLRRIAPCLLLVLATTLLLGFMVLQPEELGPIYSEFLFSTLFSANIYFWLESGYFDVAAITRPLLHIWSLGVEEQFYLFWPFLLWVFRGRSINVLFIISLITLASFVSNILLIPHHKSAAFFLPIPRIWEFSIGALIAVHKTKINPKFYADIFVILGLIFIAAASLLINEKSAFPGWYACLPVIGASLILSAGFNSRLNKTVFNYPPLVYVGLISYPLYLWHWPILSYVSTISGGAPGAITRIVAISISFVMAHITYRYIEKPIRLGILNKIFLTKFLVYSLLVFALIGLILIFTKESSRQYRLQRQPPITDIENSQSGNLTVYANPSLNKSIDTSVSNESARGIDASPGLDSAVMGRGLFEYRILGCLGTQNDEADIRDCFRDKRETPIYAVWGDSHANALMPGLLRESSYEFRWAQLGAGGCPPLAGGILRVGDPDPGYDTPTICRKANAAIIKILESNSSIKSVLLVTAARVVTAPVYSSSVEVPPYDFAIVRGLSAAANQLHTAGKEVYFLIDNPIFSHPKYCINRTISLEASEKRVCSQTREEHLKTSAKYLNILRQLREASPFIKFIDASDVLCIDGICSISYRGNFLYTDGDHLSDTGNSLVAKYVINSMHGYKKSHPNVKNTLLP